MFRSNNKLKASFYQSTKARYSLRRSLRYFQIYGGGTAYYLRLGIVLNPPPNCFVTIMSYNGTTPAPVSTQAQEATKDLRFDALARKIEHDQGGKAAKLGDLPLNWTIREALTQNIQPT